MASPGSPSNILKGIVNVKSIELPSMNYVTAGMPEESFLMHKMDGDQCQFVSMCSTSGSAPAQMCGVVMPQAGCALEPTTAGGVNPRDTVRRWIAQGALDN
jgi:hypothetical protein